MDETDSSVSSDAVAVVQEQVDAYNARDINRFVACYASNATVLDENGDPLYQGHMAIRAAYEGFFAQSPALHVNITARMHLGAWVVDEEVATGIGVGSMPSEVHAIAIYQVVGSKIQRVQLLS